MSDALLVLSDGSTYAGRSVGVEGRADGEIVFNTSMTGYQEMLTDPSYAGQLLTLTYPMIGNYGVDAKVEESSKIQPAGLIVREAAPFASHPRSSATLSTFLRERGVVAIDGIDTRSVTRRIRQHGVMLGTITINETAAEALDRVRAMQSYDDTNWVETVTTTAMYDWPDGPGESRTRRIALLDGGVKRNIMRSLAARGCAVRVFPSNTSADDLLAMKPDGIVLSPGPGDPRLLDEMVKETAKLIGRATAVPFPQVYSPLSSAGRLVLPRWRSRLPLRRT